MLVIHATRIFEECESSIDFAWPNICFFQENWPKILNSKITVCGAGDPDANGEYQEQNTHATQSRVCIKFMLVIKIFNHSFEIFHLNFSFESQIKMVFTRCSLRDQDGLLALMTCEK